MCTDKNEEMLMINRLPKPPGWREAVLAGRGQQHLQAGSMATGGNWVSTQQSSLQAVGQELLKGWVRPSWLG